MQLRHVMLGLILAALAAGAVWKTWRPVDSLDSGEPPARPPVAQQPRNTSQSLASAAADRAAASQRFALAAAARKNIARADAPHQHRVNVVTFAPDGSRLATAGAEGDICTWSIPDLKPLLHLHPGGGEIFDLSWSPDAKYLLCGGRDATITVWDASTGALVDRHTQLCAVIAVRFFPDGRNLVSTCGEVLRFWKMGEDDELFDRSVDTDTYLQSMAITSNGQVVVGNRSGDLFVFDGDGNALERKARPHLHAGSSDATEKNIVVSLRALPGNKLLVCDYSGIWLWDREKTGDDAFVLLDPAEGLSHPALSPDGLTLITGGGSNSHLIDMRTKREVLFTNTAGGELRSLDIDPLGRWYAQGSGGINMPDRIDDFGPASVQTFDLKAAQALPPPIARVKAAASQPALLPWH